jgi:signal transduction histidine kinase/DNA-binding response OmpR family regulator
VSAQPRPDDGALDPMPMPSGPLRVLLVEDNPGDALLVEEALREGARRRRAGEGYVLAHAARLAEGIEHLAREPVDLVLLDLGLPDSEGLDALARVRAQAPESPVIVLSGLADEVSVARALRGGAQDYLIKGADGELLQRAVRYALLRKTAEHDRRALADEHAARLDAEDAARREGALAAAARALAAAQLDEAAVLEAVARWTTSVLGGGCAVGLASEDGTAVRAAAVYHPDAAELAWARAQMDAQPAWLSRLRLPTADTATTVPVASGEARRIAAVPLSVDARAGGALLSWRLAGEPPHGPADLAALRQLADGAAVAIGHARLYAEARRAVAAREEFLAVATHELRTPLTSLRGNAQLLAREQARGPLATERAAELLRRVLEGVDRLGALVGDLLDVSRMRAGQLTVDARPVDLVALLDAVVRRHAAAAPEHTLRFAGQVDTCILAADPGRLEQVFDNLIANALKYSPHGGTVQVGLHREQGSVHVTVADDGIGLPPGAAERVFEPFGRGANAVERAIPGLGLGLYICRSIVERHGGRLWAESEGEGRGTTVHLVLPCAEGESRAAEPGVAGREHELL